MQAPRLGEVSFSSRWRPRGAKPPVSRRPSTLAKQVQLCILHVFTLEVQPTKQFESSRSAERMIHVVKDSTKSSWGKVWSNFLDFLGLNYNISWHSHHQSRVERRSCTATRQMLSRALPALGIGVDMCGLVVPKGTRQYKAQGLGSWSAGPKKTYCKHKKK